MSQDNLETELLTLTSTTASFSPTTDSTPSSTAVISVSQHGALSPILSFLDKADSNTYVFASFGLAVLFLIVGVLLARRRSKSRGDVVLLVGPTDGGKTAILSSLVYNQAYPTLASLQTNSSVYKLPSNNRSLRIVDVPGHPRIREQFQDEMPNAQAVIFVVNSSTISRNGAVVAEHLHHILHAITSIPPRQTPPSLVVLAHKCDLFPKSSSSKSTAAELAIGRVQSVLERELEKRRASQVDGVGVEGLGEEGEATEMGGLECSGKMFRFAEWEGGEVAFFGTSVVIGKPADDDETVVDGLAPFRDWLEDLS